MGTVFGMISFLLRWWCCGRTKLILVTKPRYFDKTAWVDSIAVSVFADMFIVLTNTDRQQDPNNYSDTVTRVLSRPGKSDHQHVPPIPWGAMAIGSTNYRTHL